MGQIHFNLPKSAKVCYSQGFAERISDFAANGKALLVVLGRLPVTALSAMDDAQISQRAGFTHSVTDVSDDGHGLLVVLSRLRVAALSAVDDA